MGASTILLSQRHLPSPTERSDVSPESSDIRHTSELYFVPRPFSGGNGNGRGEPNESSEWDSPLPDVTCPGPSPRTNGSGLSVSPSDRKIQAVRNADTGLYPIQLSSERSNIIKRASRKDTGKLGNRTIITMSQANVATTPFAVLVAIGHGR